MNAARSIVSQPQSPPASDAKAAHQGPRELETGAPSHLSPALLLQSRLEAALESEGVVRWPGLVRMSLIIGGSLVAWAAVLTAAARLLH